MVVVVWVGCCLRLFDVCANRVAMSVGLDCVDLIAGCLF